MRSAKFDALLSRYYTIIIFLIPALTIFTLFVVLPIGEAAYYSFLDGMAMAHLRNLLDLKIMNYYSKIECLLCHSKIIFI